MIADSPVPPRRAADPPAEFLGPSAAVRELLELARRVAASQATILLQGEAGTGKAGLAAAIHQWSPRASGPLIRVDCGSLASDALERELFGAAGDSSGDAEQKVGRLEAAHTGTLFLEDVDFASPIAQAKLLRVLREQQYELVGDPRPLAVDVRVIAASPRDLAVEVAEGRFREDLYWRLAVVPLWLPPLRRRREDVVALANHFLQAHARTYGRSVARIAPDALAALQQYGWPGNVRELESTIERGVVLADGETMTLAQLPGAVLGQPHAERSAFRGSDPQSLIEEFVHNQIVSAGETATDLHARVVDPVERELITQVMRACQKVQKKAADRLGMNRNTLHKKLKQHGLGE
jgi:DNA-binding NtrC family response regulator